MANCTNCGGSIGFGRRLAGMKRCEACDQRVKAECGMALSQYDAAAKAVVDSGQVGPETARLAELKRAIAAGGQPFEPRKVAVFNHFLEQALADEVLTLAEEQRLNTIGSVLLTDQTMRSALVPYRERLFIAMVNDGRLPSTTNSSKLMLKKGEAGTSRSRRPF